MITLSLPFPPSSNNLYRNATGRGRVKTGRYLTWLRAAGNEVLATPLAYRLPIAGQYSMVLTLAGARRWNKDGSRKKIDANNFVKAPEDLLVAHHLIDDDRWVEHSAVAWDDRLDDRRCEIRVWPWSAERAAIRELPPEGPLFAATGQGEAA